MIKDNNGPTAPYPGPSGPTDTGEGHGSGIEQASSEPKQGDAQQTGKPEDWTPPPGNPGSDQDSQLDRENGTAKTETPTPNR
ncbi:hypothetical protein [Pseudomonas alabamensis]|jgi:hypothetical protein|uniref:hypothetical protein n=1 Tax=Pseudomonas alabamensis TaxID=3064349 RepID=UPI000745D185|nr:hypothetical protein [Pseudomonas entomophila]AMA46165.1 hypothetical protein APT63_11295 [Pseudomonas monteilii]